MNKRVRQFICVILAILFIVSNFTTTFAYEGNKDTEIPTDVQTAIDATEAESEGSSLSVSPEPTSDILLNDSKNAESSEQITEESIEVSSISEISEEIVTDALEEDKNTCQKTIGCILPDNHEGDCFIHCRLNGDCALKDGHEGECFIPCTKTIGCKYEDGHDGECFVLCSLSEGCLLQDGHEGECVFEEANNLPYNLNGMPEGYVLSDTELDQKETISEKDIDEQVEGAVCSEDYVQNQVVLLVESEDKAQVIAQAYNGELKEYTDGVAVVQLSDINVEQAIEVAGDMENNMPAVFPNYIYSISPVKARPKMALSSSKAASVQVPKQKTWANFKDSDPALSTPTSSNYQWHHDMINSYEAWSTADGEGVKVAVLDTGVSINHPDLAGRCQYIDMVGVEDVTTNDDTGANGGHGTNVAGIIAATLGNHKGGAGVAPKSSVYSVCVLPNGRGTSAVIAVGLQRAIDADVDIINMSFGACFYDKVEDQLIQDAVNHGITVVASMGNDGTNSVYYPAAYNNVIGVAAVDKSGLRANYSNYGSWADIAAPGTDIYSTNRDGGYEQMSGTSAAAPIVSGVLALYISKVGHVSPAVALKKIQGCVTKSTSSGIGAGIIDASKLFSTVKTKPIISVTYNGTTQSLRETVPYEAEIKIEADSTANNGAMIVYTLDGKNPTVKDGEVTYGNIYDSANPITLEPYKGKKITVKAICISDMGTVSDTASQSISVSALPVPTELSIIVGNTISSGNTMYLCPGKSLQFNVKSTPEKSFSSYTWSVENNASTAGVTVDQKGKLSSRITDNGTVTLKVSSKFNPGINKTLTVQIDSDFRPLKTMTLNMSKATIGVGVGSVQLIPNLVDTWNINRTSDSRNLIEWTSSNAAIASVDANGNVTGNKKGSTVITCSVLDGCGKTAKCTVTVIQQAETIQISGPSMLACGKTASYLATVDTAASNKKVTWSVVQDSDAFPKATINNGKLSVPTGYPKDTLKVKAVAADGYGAEAEFQIRIAEKEANDVVITTTNEYCSPVRNPKSRNRVSAVTIANQDMPNTSQSDNTVKLDVALYAKDGSTVDNDVIWSSSNTKIATVDNTGLVSGLAKGSAVITCAAQDGSNKKSTVKVNVSEPVTNITIVGNSMSVKGKTATYTATVLPSGATNKKVNWSVLSSEVPNATINNGKLTIPIGYPSDSIQIQATAADGFGTVSEVKTITLKQAEANDVVITTSNEYCSPVRNPKSRNRVSAVTIANQDMPNTSHSDNTVKLDVVLYAKDGSTVDNDVIWSSSNTKIATVDNTGLVTGLAKGSAVITCAAQDGSNKKSTVKVNVSEPVTNITIVGNSMSVKGKTATYTATVLPSGATNKKVNWSVLSSEVPNATINNGKLTIPIGYPSDSIQIQATAADGFGAVSEVKTITLKQAEANDVVITTTNDHCSPVRNPKSKNRVLAVTIANQDMPNTSHSDNTVKLDVALYAKDGSTVDNDVIWSSSNSKIATVDNTGLVTGLAKGSAVITCAAQDGSNKKSTVKVNVSEPVSSIVLQGSQYVVAGKTYVIKSNIYPSNAGNKKLEWTVTDNGSYPKVTINGGTLTIPAGCQEKDITVTATAMDNCGATSSMNVHIWPVTQMIVYTSDTHCNPQTNPKLYNSITAITLASLDLPETSSTIDNKTTLNLSFIKNGAVVGMIQQIPYTWSSSNRNIATVDENGNVEAKASGKAVLTCTLQDGSNQRATVTVNVVTPASSLKIVSPVSSMYDVPLVSVGKTISHKVAFGDGYGKPTTTVRDVSWNIVKIYGDKYRYNFNTGKTDELGKDINLTNQLSSSVVLNNSGTLTIKKTNILMEYVDGYYTYNDVTFYTVWVEIAAKANDMFITGTDKLTDTIEYEIVLPATYLKSYGTVAYYDETECYTGIMGGYFDTDGIQDYTITSSNPYVCSFCSMVDDNGEIILFDWDDEEECSIFYVACNKAGTASVTLRANDGSNKSCSFRFVVTEDIVNGGHADVSSNKVARYKKIS